MNVQFRLSTLFILTLLLMSTGSHTLAQKKTRTTSDNKAGLELYLSPEGNDDGQGTLKSPWKTIQRAQQHIRSLKEGKGLPENGIVVWLLGGRYDVGSGLKMTAADSGLPGKPIIYKAYKEEKVSVFNGRTIDPALWKPLSSNAVQRLHPAVKPEQLRELDFSNLGIKNANPFADRFINWTLFDFFVNDVRQPVAQWPNLDENIRRMNEPGWTTCNGSKDIVTFHYAAGGNPTDNDTVNEVDFDGTRRAERWRNSMMKGHRIWLKGFWRIPWEAYTVRIGGINLQEKAITLIVNANQGMGSKYSPPADPDNSYRIGDGKEKWCAVNLLDEIDRPGEWAYDFKDKKLCYYPVNPQQINAYIADKSEAVISVQGASHLQFQGLTVEGSQGNGFDLKNTTDIQIAGCKIRNVGSAGIWDDGGINTIIRSNDIFETGGTGITIHNAGNRAKLIPANSVVENNHIHHNGKLTYLYAIFVKNSIGIRFANNLMHDIAAGGFSTLLINDCIFEYNEFHNIALKVADMGAYYGYGGWTCYGNEIRYNFAHHINRANAWYSDDGTSGKNFYNNIAHGAIKPFLIGGGHHNIGRNNLVVDCESSGSIDDRGIARKYLISNNFGKAVRDIMPDEEPWKSYGVQLMKKYGYPVTDMLWSAKLDTLWRPEYPNGSMLYDNVEVHAKGFSKPKAGTVTVRDNVSINKIEEAGFKDYKNMDLRTDNAIILGKFPELNTVFPKIGLYKDEFRKTVPTRQETGGLECRSAAGNKAYEDAVNR